MTTIRPEKVETVGALSALELKIAGKSQELDLEKQRATEAGPQALALVGCYVQKAAMCCQEGARLQQELSEAGPSRGDSLAGLASCALGACRFGPGLKSWGHARSDGVEGNLMTFNTAIASLAKAKQWSLALRCFHALRRKSAVSYGAAMGAVDRWEEALELLGRACQEVQVSVVLFNACLGACAERQAWRWALQLPRQLEQRSLRRTSSTQSAAVSALVRHWSWALLLLDGGNAIVYNAAIAVCAGGHQRSAALSLLAELRRISLERDAISYTSALGLGATWTEALRLAERARAEQLLDLVCCGAAVNACELAAQWLAAVQLLAATQRLSFQQDDAIYNSVISACKGAVQQMKADVEAASSKNSQQLQADLAAKADGPAHQDHKSAYTLACQALHRIPNMYTKAAELAEESKAREPWSLEAAGRQMQQQPEARKELPVMVRIHRLIFSLFPDLMCCSQGKTSAFEKGERELTSEKADLERRSGQVSDLSQKLEAGSRELSRKTADFEQEGQKAAGEKADLERRCSELQQECGNLQEPELSSSEVQDLSQKLEASNQELSRSLPALEQFHLMVSKLNTVWAQDTRLLLRMRPLKRGRKADFEQEGQKAAAEKSDLERRGAQTADFVKRRTADFEQQGQKAAGEKSDLEQRCSELQQECGNLSQKLDASNQELSRRTADFEQEGQKAAGEKADLERRCSELQEECGRLSSDLKDTSRKLEASSQELSRTQAELESELGKAGEERSLLEKRRLELERSCDELREERRQLGSKLEEQAERAAEMQQEELRQRRDMEEAQRGAAERSAAEREALQQQLSQVEQAKASSQTDAETKSGQIRDLEAQVAALDLQLRTEEQSAREAHDKLSLQCEQLQKDCERLSSEVSSASEQLEASHEELTRKVAAFQTSEEQLEAEKADLHRRCEDLQEKCANLSSAVDNRDKELDAAQKSFTEHAASAGAEAEQLRSQQAQVEQRLKEAEERCRTLQLEFDAEVAAIKEEHGTARRAAAAAEEHLRAESANAQEELARKSSEFEEDRQRLGGAHAELDQRHRLLAGQHETLQAEHVQLQEKHEALSSSAAAQREEAERKQKELEEAHGSAAEEAQQLQQRLAQSSQESEALLQEQQRLQSQVEEHLKTTSRISESCSEQERQLAEKEKEVEQLNFKMQQLKDDLEQEKQQLLAQLSNMETSYEQKLTTMEEQASWSASELRNEYKQELDQEKALFEESLAAAKRRRRIAKEEGEAAELLRRHREELRKLQAACAATGQKLEEERMQTTSRITELNAGHDRKVAERDEKVELLGGQLREQAMELEKERQSHAARVAEIEASYEQKVFTLEEAATALKSEYHQDMDQQKAHFEESLEQAAQRLENLQATHGKSLEEKEQEALELQARQKEEIQRLQDQHDELARQLEEHARNNFEEMRRKAEDLQGKSDQLQQDLAQAQDQAQRLAAEKEGLKSEMTQAQIDADHLIGETKASYERRLLEKSQALAEMEEAYRKVHPSAGKWVAFIPPRFRVQRRARDGDREESGGAGGIGWLQESWEGFNATYSKLWTGEKVTAEDVQRDLDITVAMSLAIGVFDSYVKVAPPAEPPDCVSYNTRGACCPSLACYKDLPLGLKIYVTILLLLAMRGAVRMVAENPTLSYGNAGKCLFVLAVAAQVLTTLYS
ncbi:unnamed protein product [Effrenium voratum]|nr:unnamed protein product [Effrenium voratum]